MTALNKAYAAAEAALEKKAYDLVVLEVEHLKSVADYFLVATGRSDVQVQAIARGIEDAMGKAGQRALAVEGLHHAHWVVLDYDDVVIHLFYEPAREFYRLETQLDRRARSEVAGADSDAGRRIAHPGAGVRAGARGVFLSGFANHVRDPDEDDGADGGDDDGADHAVGAGDVECAEDPSAEEATDQAEHEVADQSEALAADQLAGEPSRDYSDYDRTKHCGALIIVFAMTPRTTERDRYFFCSIGTPQHLSCPEPPLVTITCDLQLPQM